MSFFDSLKNAFSSKKEEPQQPPAESNNSLSAFIQGSPNYQYIWLEESEQDDSSSADKTAIAAFSLIEEINKAGGSEKIGSPTEDDTRRTIATMKNPLTYFSLFPMYQETVKRILETSDKDDLDYRAAVIHRLHHEKSKINTLQNMVIHFMKAYQKHTGNPIGLERLEKLKDFFYLPKTNVEDAFVELIKELDLVQTFTEDRELQVLGQVFTKGTAITISDYEKYFLVDTPDLTIVTENLFKITRFVNFLCTEIDVFKTGTHMGVEGYNTITNITNNTNGVKKLFDTLQLDYSKPGNFQTVVEYADVYKEQFLYGPNN